MSIQDSSLIIHAISKTNDNKLQILWNKSETKSIQEVRRVQRKVTQKHIHFNFDRKVGQDMKFHFAIAGHAESPEQELLIVWLQDMIAEYNERSGSPINEFHVLVSEIEK